MNNLYSVVVPIYGVELYLKKCVDSLLNQTYNNLEIILVDDGSKDNCPSICDEYEKSDSRIKVIHKQNGGLVSARRAGAKIATGDYVFCVDGDDWVSPDYIEKFDFVIQKHNPDMVCCGYIQSDEKTHTNVGFCVDRGFYDSEKIKKDIYPISIESENGIIFPTQLWAKAFKRELYVPRQTAVSELIKIGEDGAVVKPCLTNCNSLYIIDECLYYYRYNNTSMTKNKSAHNWSGPRYILNHLSEQIATDKYDFNEQITRRTARDIYTVAFSQFNKGEKYSVIKKQIIQNLKSDDYKKVLKNCKYKNLRLKLQIFLLRHHILFPIYILNKISK